MDIPINLEGFEGRELTLKTGGIIKKPRLWLDRQELPYNKVGYNLKDNQGDEISIKLEPRRIDPVPKFVVNDHAVDLVRPLEWYEIAWMWIPILIILQGGLLGAFFGLAGVYWGARVFRSEMNGVLKYVSVLGIAVASYIALFIFAMALFMLINTAMPAPG